MQYLPAAQVAIHNRTMPPWPPSAECNEYLGDLSLAPELIELIDTWVDEGTPEGDSEQEGAPLELDMPSLSRVDEVLTVPEAYVPVQAPDDYRCFLIEWPQEYEETVYVTGFGAVPGNPAIVHHVIAFLAEPDQVQDYRDLDAAEPGPGYTCFGGSGGPSRTWLGGWAPGGQGADLPEGLGMEVQPGSMVVLQVHYNSTTLDVEPDATSIELKVDPQVERPARIMPLANPQWLGGAMEIPAGEPDVIHEFSFDPTNYPGASGNPMTIYSATLHMHLLGSAGEITVQRAAGESECVLQIDEYDFNWQNSYQLRQPITVQPGDELTLRCHHDNSAENQPYIDGQTAQPQDVHWGEGTTDEMCLGVFLVAD